MRASVRASLAGGRGRLDPTFKQTVIVGNSPRPAFAAAITSQEELAGMSEFIPSESAVRAAREGGLSMRERAELDVAGELTPGGSA